MPDHLFVGLPFVTLSCKHALNSVVGHCMFILEDWFTVFKWVLALHLENLVYKNNKIG